MAFVDIKCLESLLIEEDELTIANEGIGSMITGLFKTLSRVFMNAINIIINCFRKLYTKLKRSKGKKNTNTSRPVSTDKSAERDVNVKKEASQAETNKQFEELEERKKKFEENSKARHEELHKAVNSLNETMKKRDNNNEVSGSKITEDVMDSIRCIEKVTQLAEKYMTEVLVRKSEDADIEIPRDLGNVLDNIDILQNSIDLYDLADEKLSDSNKDMICDKLQTVTMKLEKTKADFDNKYQLLYNKLSEINKTDGVNKLSLRYQGYLKRLQSGLIDAQKLAISLAKIM